VADDDGRSTKTGSTANPSDALDAALLTAVVHGTSSRNLQMGEFHIRLVDSYREARLSIAALHFARGDGP
jgi:hypothetical protein